MNTHPSLVDQINPLGAPRGHLALWALGQHGFLLRGGATTVIIDPYLSNGIAERDGSDALKRLIPIVADPSALSMIDVALITHAHTDHCDPQTIPPLLQAAPHAQVFGSYVACDRLVECGVDRSRIAVPPVDQPLRVNDDLTITPIPAAHYEFESDADGNPAYLGFVVQINGVTLYHSGDTIVYPGLIERLKPYALDIACLPINGRDWFREQAGLVGNLDYREAAELAVSIGARVLIPAHNDLFASNRINPAYFVDYIAAQHPRQRWHMLQAGELYYYAG
jgi:L-ascorbate 6-phosphate lactonase